MTIPCGLAVVPLLFTTTLENFQRLLDSACRQWSDKPQ